MVTIRATLTALALLALLAFPAAASHPGDLDCADFESQADAQAHYRNHPDDPDGLDRDDDGVACENNPAPRDEAPVSMEDEDEDTDEDGETGDPGGGGEQPEMPDSGGGATGGAGVPVGPLAGLLSLLAAGGYTALRRR